MPTYKAPTGDARFLINEVLRLQDYAALPGFAGATPDMVEAVVEEAGKFCSEVLAPINLAGDQEGCTRALGQRAHFLTDFRGNKAEGRLVTV